MIWAYSSELQAGQMAGGVVQRLGGAARTLAREIPPEALRNGRRNTDAAGNVVVETGLDLLVRGLEARFGARDFEVSVSSVVDILSFRRLPGEETDEALSRFEVIEVRADSLPYLPNGDRQFVLSRAVTSWLLLSNMHVKRDYWPTLLASYGGTLPTTDDEYKALPDAIRTQTT